jgi:hypothetical protein
MNAPGKEFEFCADKLAVSAGNRESAFFRPGFSETKACLFVAQSFVEGVRVDPFLVARHFDENAALVPQPSFRFFHQRATDALSVQ